MRWFCWNVQCVNGMSAYDAWMACGQPRGQAGVQNVRKRAARLNKRITVAVEETVVEAAAATPAPPPPPQTAVPRTSEGSTKSAKKSPAFRLRPDQVQKQAARKAEMKAAFDQVYVEATNEYCEMVRTGKCGKGALSADGLAERYSAKLPEGCTKKLTGRSLKNAVREGRVGQAPAVPGRKSKVPDVFVKSIAEYAQMQQLAGDV